MLFQCWASGEDVGPTLKQHWEQSQNIYVTFIQQRPNDRSHVLFKKREYAYTIDIHISM